VAVVGVDRLTNLERSILPAEYDEVDPFIQEPFHLPSFHVFDSSAAIVDALLDAITIENAADVAIVLDGESAYSSLVESALEGVEIPFHGGPGFIDDPVGLRQRKVYAEDDGHPHIYDNWRADVLRRCIPRDYDEERRLLYVAMTRAKSHLVFSAGENPNTFVEELPVEVQELVPEVDQVDSGETVQTRLQITVPTPDGPIGRSPHSLMSDDVFEETPEGKGTEFGIRAHELRSDTRRARK
jgi:hypothetical protein